MVAITIAAVIAVLIPIGCLQAGEGVVQFAAAPADEIVTNAGGDTKPIAHQANDNQASGHVGPVGRGCDDRACDALACDDLGCDDCASSACTSCQACCQPICCCPRWIVTPEVMYLRRKTSSPLGLVNNQTTGATLLSTSDFDDDYEAIPRLQMIYEGWCCNGLEVNLFGLEPFDTVNFSSDTASPLYLGPGTPRFPLGSTDPGLLLGTDYETRLSSVEANYRHYCGDCVTFVTGFRWIELGDELDVNEVAPNPRDLFSVDTNNHMYGFQLGLDAILWNYSDRFYIDSGFRAAILYNRADQDFDSPFFAALPGTVGQLSARDDHTAFFGEVGIDGVVQVTDHLAIRAGYQFMWLEGVALAPDQLPLTNVIGPGSAGLDTSGGLFLSGATLGVTLSF